MNGTNVQRMVFSRVHLIETENCLQILQLKITIQILKHDLLFEGVL